MIGTKLKNARTKSGLTQEKVAEEIGVSRQSVSNWENGRSYPDIVSVIKLSDLYSVSLDELLKEDKNMIRHLSEATDVVKSNRQLINRLTIAAYWVCWAMVFLIYVLVKSAFPALDWDLRLMVPGVVFIIVTMLIGANKDFSRIRWLYVPITGIMFILYVWLWNIRDNLRAFYRYPPEERNFSFLNVWKDFICCDVEHALLWGLGCSLIGMFVGTFIRYAIIINSKKDVENNAADGGGQLNQTE